jgi:xanthine dehydrogenase accessory factor
MTPLAPTLRAMLARGEPCALVTVAGARGSTPRELGTRMLVGPNRIAGTIGGGRLEYDAMAQARALLAGGGDHALEEVPLGPALGQCCGGHATVLIEAAGEATLAWLEPLERGGPGVLLTPLGDPAERRLVRDPHEGVLPPALAAAVGEALARREPAKVEADGTTWLIELLERNLPQVLLFGAGHVGRALATALAPLPCRVRWIDDRAQLLADPPEGIEVIHTRHPQDRVGEAPPGSFFLVMTPSHDLDCELCELVLKRGDFAFLGLIGSATKRARFERRWRARGVPEDQIARLVCPIGIPGIAGKQPAVIAAATAAQLLLAFEAAQLGSRPAMPST